MANFFPFARLPLELQELIVHHFYGTLWTIRPRKKDPGWEFEGMPSRAPFLVSRNFNRWSKLFFLRKFSGCLDLNLCAEQTCTNDPDLIKLIEQLDPALQIIRCPLPMSHKGHFGPCAITGDFTRAPFWEHDVYLFPCLAQCFSRYPLDELLSNDKKVLEEITASLMAFNYFADWLYANHLHVGKKQHIIRGRIAIDSVYCDHVYRNHQMLASLYSQSNADSNKKQSLHLLVHLLVSRDIYHSKVFHVSLDELREIWIDGKLSHFEVDERRPEESPIPIPQQQSVQA